MRNYNQRDTINKSFEQKKNLFERMVSKADIPSKTMVLNYKLDFGRYFIERKFSLN